MNRCSALQDSTNPHTQCFRDKGSAAKKARKICARCEVTSECLDYAMTFPTINGLPLRGVWGGKTERDRLDMRMGRVTS